MESDILLSIIVTAYNVADWLPRCLDSICAQTYRNLEIIVIDDGSTDKTPDIIDEYAVRDQRIRVIHQENKGLAKSRDIGIHEANGIYTGFVDGDDEIIPEMYERLLKNAIRYKAQISQCGIMYCFYDGKRIPIHGSENLKVYNRIDGCAALLQGIEMEPSLCNKIYLSTILKDSCLDYAIRNNEDMLRNIVLFNRITCSVMDDFCGYLYWRRNNSMSNNVRAIEKGKDILYARKLILMYVPEELKNKALGNYLGGAIITYNSLIDVHSIEADKLREDCRNILKEGKVLCTDLTWSMKIKRLLILFFSKVYDMARIIYVRRKKKKTKR